MGNNYPKSYVLDRIAARRASLQRTIATRDAFLASYNAKIATQIVRFANDQAQVIHQFQDANLDLMAVDPANIDEMREATRLRQVAFSKIAGQSAPQFINRLSHYAPDDRSSEPLLKEGVAADRELDALEHAEAYLQGTPVDEFTLTGLKSLGLIDAIKFDLGRAKEAKR